MAEKSVRKLSIIASKGSLDMAYPPLILANAARMSGVEVNLFFTFWGLDIITKKKLNHLNVAVVGNPSMHPWVHIPTLLGIIPGMSAAASWMMRREIAKLDFRSEEHTSEIQAPNPISYAGFCLKQKNKNTTIKKNKKNHPECNKTCRS